MLLEVDTLSLTIDARRILAAVTLGLGAGETLAVVGPNGAGKTTLLRAIAGLERRIVGRVRIEGRSVRELDHDALARLVGFVPQRLEFLPNFEVQEFLEMSGTSPSADADKLVAGLEKRELPELSGGELQRVLLAGALVQGARLLLLDEPTANLDPRGKLQVEDSIQQVRSIAGSGCILVTHDVDLAARTADTVIVMKLGEVIFRGAGTEPEFLAHLASAYDCAFLRVPRPGGGPDLIVPSLEGRPR